MITLKKGVPIVVFGRVREGEEPIDITGWNASFGVNSAYSGKQNIAFDFNISDQQQSPGGFTISVEDSNAIEAGEYTCDLLLTPPEDSAFKKGYTQSVKITIENGVAS